MISLLIPAFIFMMGAFSMSHIEWKARVQVIQAHFEYSPVTIPPLSSESQVNFHYGSFDGQQIYQIADKRLPILKSQIIQRLRDEIFLAEKKETRTYIPDSFAIIDILFTQQLFLGPNENDATELNDMEMRNNTMDSFLPTVWVIGENHEIALHETAKTRSSPYQIIRDTIKMGFFFTEHSEMLFDADVVDDEKLYHMSNVLTQANILAMTVDTPEIKQELLKVGRQRNQSPDEILREKKQNIWDGIIFAFLLVSDMITDNYHSDTRREKFLRQYAVNLFEQYVRAVRMITGNSIEDIVGGSFLDSDDDDFIAKSKDLTKILTRALLHLAVELRSFAMGKNLMKHLEQKNPRPNQPVILILGENHAFTVRDLLLLTDKVRIKCYSNSWFSSNDERLQILNELKTYQ